METIIHLHPAILVKKKHYASELLHDLDFWHLESSPAASETHPVMMIYDDVLDDFSSCA